MSMTQEEIEALMNDTVMDSSDNSDDYDINDLLAGIDSVVDDGVKSSNNYSGSIDDLLAGIDGIVDADEKNDTLDETDMDALLAGIGGIAEDKPASVPKKESNPAKVVDDISSKIDKGIYPLPADKEHKVVNQLNEVAEDSEEKASQIFDVLSFILDENDVIQKETNKVSDFVNSQIKLLETLTVKFPNVEIFYESLQKAKDTKEAINSITDGVNNENNKVFEAMEIMQYHDINRQKIERVMAVIRKLSLYLSGLFEDDSGKPEVQIAKHISGDSSQTVSEDDLDSLIAEFNHE